MPINENKSFKDYVSGIRLPDCSNLAVSLKNGNGVTIFRYNVLAKFFLTHLCFYSKFSYWFKFHVIIATGVMTTSFYNGLTRNLEIGNIPIWIFPNIWKLGQVRKQILAQTSLIKCYWMLQNTRITAFTVSELFREDQLGVWGEPHQSRFKKDHSKIKTLDISFIWKI